MTDLQGKVIILTGAASGIGRAAAEIAAQRGASVVIADMNEVLGAQVAEGIERAGGEAGFVRLDVTQEEQVVHMVATTLDRFGRLDGAFNNVGMPPTTKLLHEITLAEWQRSIAVNLTGTFLCMKYEIEAMLRTGGGSIVNTSSAAGLRGNTGFSEYIAGKHGVIGLSRAGGVEYGAANIRVNALVPGAVQTPMLGEVNGFAFEKYPLKRIAKPSELGEAAVWLLSDAASYVTGTYLAVDGGTTAT